MNDFGWLRAKPDAEAGKPRDDRQAKNFKIRSLFYRGHTLEYKGPRRTGYAINTMICALILASALIAVCQTSSVMSARAEVHETERLPEERSEPRARESWAKEKVDLAVATGNDWPSEHADSRPNHYMSKYVVDKLETLAFECRSPLTQDLNGWFTHGNLTHVRDPDGWYAITSGSECRENVRVDYFYRQCDTNADPLHMLCEAGKPNITLFNEGGRSEQGCQTADWVADYASSKDVVLDRLVDSGE